MNYSVVDRRDAGLIAETEFVQKQSREGWELCAVIVLPTTWARLDNNIFRYFFKQPQHPTSPA